MSMDDLERMKLLVEIYHEIKELTPEDIEAWRTVCLAICSQDDNTQEFINRVADVAGHEGKIC